MWVYTKRKHMTKCSKEYSCQERIATQLVPILFLTFYYVVAIDDIIVKCYHFITGLNVTL